MKLEEIRIRTPDLVEEIPYPVLRAGASMMAQEYEMTVRARVRERDYLGGQIGYSNRVLWLDLERTYESQGRQQKWQRIVNRIPKYMRNRQGEGRWATFSGKYGKRGAKGYREFKQLIGQRADRVTMRLTGQMLEDLTVVGRVYRNKRRSGSEDVWLYYKRGQKTRAYNRNATARIEAELGFLSAESARIAEGHHTGNPKLRPFAFLTQSEYTRLHSRAEYAMLEAVRMGITGRGRGGQFESVPDLHQMFFAGRGRPMAGLEPTYTPTNFARGGPSVRPSPRRSGGGRRR